MKTLKKLMCSLVVFLAVAIVFWFASAPKALADTDTNYVPTTQTEISGATFNFQDRSTIIGHFKSASTGQIVDVPFILGSLSDGTYRYKHDPSQTNWCDEGHNGGIYFDDKNGADSIAWNNPRLISSAVAHVDIDYATFAGNGKICHNTTGGITAGDGIYNRTVTNADGLYNYFSWNGVALETDSAAMGSLGLPGSDRLSPTQEYLNKPTGIPPILVSDNDECPAEVVKVSGDGKGGTAFILVPMNPFGGVDINRYISTWPSSQCGVKAINFIPIPLDSSAISDAWAKEQFFITGTIPSSGDNSGQPGAGGGGTGNTPPSCEANFHSAFGWIICPVLGLADDTISSFGNFVDDQLCFKTTTDSTSSTGSSIVCKGNNNLSSGVHNAWNIFKNIASALLVIVMLIMVISQAIGGGPFDAYTVRKILPRLVAGVILMQISWILFKFTIDLSNDFGKAIGSLMMAPFGGPDNLKLEVLMGKAFAGSSGWTNSALAVSFYAIAGVAALAASIPGILLLALYVMLAVLTAFIVLIFRKLLIILLVILAPLALILWLLPGTDRYWKMWQDNFTKLLLMYPMIMGLIAAGRIFASITAGNAAVITLPHPAIAHLGPLPVPYFASATHFVELGIIIGAYFAPYFLLPQTFKWGGAAMGAIGKGVPQALEKMGGKQAKEYLNWRQGLSPWKQARAARKAEVERRAHHGFYESLNSTGVMGSVRRARLGGVGARGEERHLRGRIVENAQSEIDKHIREEDQRAIIELTRRTLPQFHADDHDNIREAILQGRRIMVHLPGEATVDAAGNAIAGTHEFDGAAYGSDPHRLRAAADRALIHGQRGAVDQYYTEAMASGDAARIAEATRFKDDNADNLGRTMTHVLKGYGVAVQSTAAEIAQQSGHEVESIIAEFSSRVAEATARGDIAGANAAQAQLDGYIQRHQEALANPSLRGSVDLRGTRAVEAYTELRTSPNPTAPATVAARAIIDEINQGDPSAVATGRDREANRSRYQTPGLPADHTIPLIQI